MKYEGQVKSGHNSCCLCSFLAELWRCRVTYENCYKSSVFNLVWGEWMDLRNFNGIELRNFHFTIFSRKFLSEVEKCIMGSSILVLPNQVSKISFYTFKDIDLRESHAKLHKKLSETPGADSIYGLEINICYLPQNFNWFSLYFAQSSFTEMKSTLIKLQNEYLQKDIGQKLRLVNHSVNVSHFLHHLESGTSNLWNSLSVARDLKYQNWSS